MRILLLNDASTPMGGAELQIVRLRELLREAGHEVRLLSSTASTIGGTPAADVTCFGTTRPKLRVATQTANPSAALRLRHELAAFGPDVVHLRMFLTQLSPLVLAMLRQVPTIWQAVYYKAICPRGTKVLPDGSRCRVPAGVVCLRNRCVTPQSWVLDMTQMRLWRRWSPALDAVVTLSEGARRHLEAAGIPVTAVIPNGVDVPPPRPPLPAQPLAAFAGRLVPAKGVDVLLRAFAAVATTVPAARLVVAGDGPDRSALESLAAELGIAGRTAFLGHVPRAELEQAFAGAWVQAVPGRWDEPLGNVTLEAMARGTAVVATDVGGPGEVVRDGRSGVLVPAGEVAPLAAALERLLRDRERCERLGAEGRATVGERYGQGRVVERLEAVYEQVLRRARPSDHTR